MRVIIQLWKNRWVFIGGKGIVEAPYEVGTEEEGWAESIFRDIQKKVAEDSVMSKIYMDGDDLSKDIAYSISVVDELEKDTKDLRDIVMALANILAENTYHVVSVPLTAPY